MISYALLLLLFRYLTKKSYHGLFNELLNMECQHRLTYHDVFTTCISIIVYCFIVKAVFVLTSDTTAYNIEFVVLILWYTAYPTCFYRIHNELNPVDIHVCACMCVLVHVWDCVCTWLCCISILCMYTCMYLHRDIFTYRSMHICLKRVDGKLKTIE